MTLPSPDPMPGPYAHAAEEWRDAGWSPLPLPPRAKAPPPDGYTGREGKDPDAQQVAAWISERPDANIGLRMPQGVIGIDVDAYKEVGATSWNELVLRCGPLPVSWLITSRNDGTSGIRLYRVPVGVELRGVAAPGIEILQHHHRYAVTWPSIHPSGELYRLIGPDGADDCPFPAPSELPWLPEKWIEALAEVPREPGEAKVREHTGEWSHAVQAAFAEGMAGMVKGSRHDVARDCCLALARLEALDHPGATPALQSLGRWLIGAIQDRSTLDEAAKEWGDMLAGARALVASTPSERPSWDELEHEQWDPWEMIGQTRPVEASEEAPPWDGPQPIDWPEFWGRERSDIQWVCYPILPRGRQAAMWAIHKTGKSLLTLEIAGACATGASVLGNPAQPALSVVYLDLEMTEDDVEERLVDLGYSPESALENLHYYLLPSLPPLDTYPGGAALAAIVDRHQAQLVVIDTISRVIQGEENDADTFRNFYKCSGLALKQRGVSLLRLDHGGKDPTKGQRGSSAKGDDVDIVWKLEPADSGLMLRRERARMSWIPDHVNLVRHADPLRHIVEGGQGFLPGTADLAAKIRAMGLAGLGANAIEKALREAGQGVRRKEVQDAVRSLKMPTPISDLLG